MEKLNFCEHCVYGKACRAKFGVGQQRTKGTLDLMHADLWGPSRTLSHFGARYFLTCVDDFSRKLWIHILKTKDQVYETFKNWKTMIENHNERKIKSLRIDNGSEFYSDFFSHYCRKMGIASHKSIARTPQQNGLAERFNRTILERVRRMLSSAIVTETFWAKVVTIVCFLISRCPSTSLNMKRPKEVWFGHPPTYDRLRVFGYVAYAHIRQDKVKIC